MKFLERLLTAGVISASMLAATAPVVAALAAPPAAPAEDESVKKAREEFRRGLALEAAGDYEGALKVYKAVALVKSTPAVRYHIAVCEENTGDWIGALGSYRLAAADAIESKVPDVAAESNAAIEKLEPRVPKLVIKRGEGAVAATILLDGKPLGSNSVSAPIPVNPGPHRVEGTAPNRKPATVEITAADGKTEEITITLEVIPTVDVVGPGGGATPPIEPKKKASALLPVGAVFVGLGGAGLVVSGVFYGLRASAISDLDAACGADQQSCPESLRGTAEDGALYDSISTATVIAGGATAALGVTLLIVEAARKPSAVAPTKTGSASASVDVRVGPQGLSVAGRF